MPPASTPPRGVEVPSRLKKVHLAFVCLLPEVEGVAVVRDHYKNVVIHRETKGQVKWWALQDLSRQKFYHLKAQGEAAIRGYMKAN